VEDGADAGRVGSVVEVRRATAEQWPTVKQIRLQALADTPWAFASTLARETALDDEAWQQRVGRGAWFLARADDGIVGLVAGVSDNDVSEARQLVGMWVCAEWRSTETGEALVQAVRRWASDDAASALTLWVAATNPRARRFYERLGFRDTGDRQPLPSTPAVQELRMSLDL